MFSRAVFYPTLLYNVMMERFSSRRWFDRIDETVILGALPLRSITSEILRLNIRAVISMTEEYETRFLVTSEKEWAELCITQLVLSTPDFIAAPTQENLLVGVRFLLEQVKQRRGSVYVHCKAGRTRSATLVACYLMQRHGWSVEQSVEFIRSKRPHIKLRAKQWMALYAYRSLNLPRQQQQRLNSERRTTR